MSNFDLGNPDDIPLPKSELLVFEEKYENIKENLIKELKDYIKFVESIDSELANFNKKEGSDEQIEFTDQYMDIIDQLESVEDTISDMHKRNICLDDYKSHYMHIAQDLQETIHCNICNECEGANGSEEEIRKLSYELFNVKNELMKRFNEVRYFIEILDCELHDLIGEK